MRAQIRRLRPRRDLRGKRLEETAIRELRDADSWRTGTPLSWKTLAARLGVSRQALATKPAVVEAYHATKLEFKKAHGKSPEAVLKRTLSDRIKELETRLRERDHQLDAWVQKWATIEYNCRLYNYDPDKLFALPPKPSLPER
jgi:hypothetical protein